MNYRDPTMSKIFIRADLTLVLCAVLVTTGLGQHSNNVKGVSLEGKVPSYSITFQSPAPFDLVWGTTDLNGIPMNPQWGWQRAVPRKLPNLEGLCLPPFDSREVGHDDPKPFRDPGCTTQNPSFDEANGFRLFTCGLVSSTVVIGHVNWMAVTYEGWLYWDVYQAYPHTLISDDDYNFRLFPRDGSGVYPGKDGTFGLEFKAEETIKCFSGWWDQFRIAVDSGKDKARQLVDGKFAIVTGLMGLDCEHGCQAELHPVWAMAIHVKDDPTDDMWAIFVRNWGNEGYCSHFQHYIDFLPASPVSSGMSDFTFLLPWRTGATSVSIGNGSKFCMNSATVGGPLIASVLSQGVLVKFTLPSPRTAPRANGELHLQWGGDQLGPSDDKPPVHFRDFAVARRVAEDGVRASSEDSKDRSVEDHNLVNKMTQVQRSRYSSYIARFRNIAEFNATTSHDSVCRNVPSGASINNTTMPIPRRTAPLVRDAFSPQLEAEHTIQDDAIYYAVTGRIPAFSRRNALLHKKLQPRRRRK